MIKLKTFWLRDGPKPNVRLKTVRCDHCRKPILHMTEDQSVKHLQLPKSGLPDDVSGMVVTCTGCGCMYIITGIVDSVSA